MHELPEVRARARQLIAGMSAGQADGSPARPRTADGAGDLRVSDLDSLSLVELAVCLEDMVGVPILDELADFPGSTVDDFAAFAVQLATRRAGKS
jgi:acyl carrier protein